ncbi:MAG: outer membrane lipoprotein carrier protein LolA [Hyphomonadaceae bacterium]
MKRRAFLLGLASLGAAAALPAAPAFAQALSGAQRTQALARASAALNAQRSLQGRFLQFAPDGSTSGGQFYLQRPGRVRFDYDGARGMLIVADGSVVAMQDRALRTTNRAPLRSTPLYFVLKNDINLERDTRVTRVVREGDALLVSTRDRSGRADGELTLRLHGPNYELRAWDVIDAAGARTRIALSNVRQAARIDPALFRAPASSQQSIRGR